MRGRTGFALAGLFVAGATVTGLCGPGAAASAEGPAAGPQFEWVPASRITAPWEPRPILGPDGAPAVAGHTLRVLARFPGYCVGDPTYKVSRVRLVERRKSRHRPFGSAVITVHGYRPGFENAVFREEGSVVYGACADLGGPYETALVRTKRPADRLVFYDGSFDPPRRIYPPPGTPPQGLRAPTRNQPL
jgi:hypothetical protein